MLVRGNDAKNNCGESNYRSSQAFRAPQRTGVNAVDVLSIHANTSEEIPKPMISGDHGITWQGRRSTASFISQWLLQKALFLLKGLHKYRRWNMCIEVARVLLLNHEHLLWHTASPGWSECWPTRELYVGRVGRVVFNWAHLHANKDDYERRIYTLC